MGGGIRGRDFSDPFHHCPDGSSRLLRRGQESKKGVPHEEGFQVKIHFSWKEKGMSM